MPPYSLSHPAVPFRYPVQIDAGPPARTAPTGRICSGVLSTGPDATVLPFLCGPLLDTVALIGNMGGCPIYYCKSVLWFEFHRPVSIPAQNSVLTIYDLCTVIAILLRHSIIMYSTAFTLQLNTVFVYIIFI